MQTMSLGMNVFQWEHKRRWDLPGAGKEFCRAEGALIVPGFQSLSVFLRRESQSLATSVFELRLWTAPIYFRPLDEDFSAAPEAYLYELSLAPANPVTTAGTGTGARVFGGQIKDGQPMGSLLFWELRNAGEGGSFVGDIYVVPNHTGSMVLNRIGRAVEAPGTQLPMVGKG